jgi:arylsulfatase A-like enzyme
VTTKLANTDVAQYRLFNLATDPAERNNLAAVHPEVFEEMKALLESIIENGRSRL